MAKRPSRTANLVQIVIQKLAKNLSLFEDFMSQQSREYESKGGEIHVPLIVDDNLVLFDM